MHDRHIRQLETQLERLVEGAFTHLFRRHVSAYDIALKLARSMETSLAHPQDDDVRPIAPDVYTIHLNPQVQQRLDQHRADWTQQLAQHLVELASIAGYRLLSTPMIHLKPDTALAMTEVIVHAEPHRPADKGTASMQPIDVRAIKPDLPHHPQLIINDQRAIVLDKTTINIGRGYDNDIILDDPYASRHHAQIRLRFGAYTLFDVQSRGGTLVNQTVIREHRLKSGDVIQIGRTKLLFLIDATSQLSATQTDDIDLVPPPQGT